MRPGNDYLKNCVFWLSLRSPFTIFAVINREHPLVVSRVSKQITQRNESIKVWRNIRRFR